MNELNLNSGAGKGKENKKPQPEKQPTSTDPQDAMSVAVSSLVNIATRIGQMVDIMSDMQTLIYDIRAFEKERGLSEGYLDAMILEEIEKDDEDDK